MVKFVAECFLRSSFRFVTRATADSRDAANSFLVGVSGHESCALRDWTQSTQVDDDTCTGDGGR